MGTQIGPSRSRVWFAERFVELVDDATVLARVGYIEDVCRSAAGHAAVVAGNVLLFGDVRDEDVGERFIFLGRGLAAGDFDGGAVPVSVGEEGQWLVGTSKYLACGGQVDVKGKSVGGAR